MVESFDPVKCRRQALHPRNAEESIDDHARVRARARLEQVGELPWASSVTLDDLYALGPVARTNSLVGSTMPLVKPGDAHTADLTLIAEDRR